MGWDGMGWDGMGWDGMVSAQVVSFHICRETLRVLLRIERRRRFECDHWRNLGRAYLLQPRSVPPSVDDSVCDQVGHSVG